MIQFANSQIQDTQYATIISSLPSSCQEELLSDPNFNLQTETDNAVIQNKLASLTSACMTAISQALVSVYLPNGIPEDDQEMDSSSSSPSSPSSPSSSSSSNEINNKFDAMMKQLSKKCNEEITQLNLAGKPPTDLSEECGLELATAVEKQKDLFNAFQKDYGDGLKKKQRRKKKRNNKKNKKNKKKRKKRKKKKRKKRKKRKKKHDEL